jgi:hypothetical protein
MQVKYDLGDWEKRKAALLPTIDAAATEGLLSRENVGKLSDFLLGRGVAITTPPIAASLADQPETLDTLIAAERPTGLEESEAPRFIRGFHDILITIGLIIGLSGLAGLATVYAIFPAIIVLGEILVRRQRLALPAVVLTLAFIAAACFAVQPVFDAVLLPSRWQPAAGAAVVMSLLALFYWRYRVPIAFALMCAVAYATIVLVVGALIFQTVDDKDFLDKYPLILAGLIGLFAALTFGTALYFDFSDRMRATRRSDVAFWLHLAAAPAILYTVITLVYSPYKQSWFDSNTSATQAGLIVLTVLVLMLVGIMLDRRAFVTSGLLSFGYAFKVLLQEGGIASFFSSTDTIGFVILLAVGVIVLTLGIGWRPLRRLVIGALPDPFAERLPPVQ